MSLDPFWKVLIITTLYDVNQVSSEHFNGEFFIEEMSNAQHLYGEIESEGPLFITSKRGLFSCLCHLLTCLRIFCMLVEIDLYSLTGFALIFVRSSYIII